jgi:phosphonatase-like hydrolase
MTSITIACLDMAGTTVRDNGAVLAAFGSAIEQGGLADGTPAYDEAIKAVRASMGQSKIEVFRRVLGDEAAARKANDAFEEHYAAAVMAGQVAPMPGAEQTMTRLREAGIQVCLNTGFSPGTRDVIIEKLGWSEMIDLALSPVDAGRGRPWPDLPLTALMRLGGTAVDELAVVGDTVSDVETGLRAGAGLVAGVLTGAATRAEFERAGTPLILDTVADLLSHLGLGQAS